ncbi:MAG: Gfo/Idh/MocA family oxidoreductase [Candidatus Omnitrophica bacterium]|nr:Gfo/Idh/MocA family oxidoreductase [Candidatus Omnitrophota bacterium]
MMMKSSRRTFLGAAAGALVLARSASPQEKTLKLGVIGVGWYGMVDAKAALKAGGVEIAAICDVDSDHLKSNADELEKLQGKRPHTFKLHQDLLNLKDLDAVIIASPPHWHAIHFIDALEKGLDIYCEKPLSYDVREGRAMADAAQKHQDSVVQIGFQRRQSQAFQQVKEFIASGKAGEIVQVDAQIHYNAAGGLKDPTPQDPPVSLDWDRWCGPGPKIPYSPQVGHFNWRLEKTSGHGHLIDWGIHLIDATRMILDLSTPKKIAASGGLYHLGGKITTPDSLTVHFEFDRCPVVWRHRLWGAEEYAPEVNNGIFFYGDQATVFASDNRWIVIPKGRNKDREEHSVNTDAGLNHMADFLNAVRGRRQPSCLIADAFQSTAAVQLGMISYESDSVVRWDQASESIIDNPQAASLLKRPYRDPWKHPYKG